MKKARRTGRLTWQAIRQRLERTVARAAEAQAPPPARVEAILEERARVLARVPEAEPAGAALEVVKFALVDERYGIEVSFVQEVVRLSTVTPVPALPPQFLGLVNLRGELLIVADLRPLLGLPVRPATPLSRVLVLGGRRVEFGVVADEAFEVGRLRVRDLCDPPESAAGAARLPLRGVTADGLAVLDGAALLRDRRFYFGQEEDQRRR